MQKIILAQPEIHCVGITARTSNAEEMQPSTAKIPATLARYFQQGLSNNIPHRKNPGVTYCIYTDYESDVTGQYTYFVGEVVDQFNTLPNGLVALTLPAQHYVKFTTSPGVMPNVCIQSWQTIWAMTDEALGGKRRYAADFEVYDERAINSEQAVLDIYIGIEI